MAVLNAATRLRATPSTVVKSPLMYMIEPSGLATRSRTVPLAVCTHVVSSAPLLVLKRAMRVRVTSPVPAAAPGGRTEVNSPPT